MRNREIRGDGKLSCEAGTSEYFFVRINVQIPIPRGMTLNTVGNYTDMRSLKSNQGSHTSEFSYLLTSSISFPGVSNGSG